MSSALTGNKIKDSYQALLKIGTNGSLDPTVPITISDGLGNDTPLQLAADKLLTNYLGNNIGLYLDFAIESYSFGDPSNVGNGNYISIDNAGNSINLNSQDNGAFFGLNRVSLDSQNKQSLINDGANQLIYTNNDNGTYSGDRGIKLDFNQNFYLFGDTSGTTGKPSYLSLTSDPNESYAVIGVYGNVLHIREYGNTWGGAQGGMQFDDAVYDNFGFNFDWKIKNNDIGQFPFYKNTIINTFGAVTTTDIAMNNNFFANNSQLSLNGAVNLSNDEVLSNCFVFGLTTMVDNNNIKFFSKHAGTYNTNVAILNGSGLRIGKGGNHIFSVNASGLDFKDDNSGITILGGDVYDESSGIYVIAHHVLSSGKCGINFTGQKAKGNNNFSNVFGYYNESYGTAIGQVQIEQKQQFANCPDGTAYYDLVDTFEGRDIIVDNNTTYLVDAKFVSTNGNGDKGSSGNWTLYRQYMICVDSSGNLSTGGTDINHFNFSGQQDVKFFTNTNAFYFQVQPDNNGGVHCWVRAEIVLHKIEAI